MVGIIVFLAIVVFIIYAAINDKKKQEEAAQKEAQEKALRESEKRKFEQQTAQKLQTTESRVSGSDFYRELLFELKTQIQNDTRNYLAKRYDEYMKKPGALSSDFKPFTYKDGLSEALGDIAIMADGIYYHKLYRQYHYFSIGHGSSCFEPERCEFQFVCSKHGYSNLDSIQMLALAQVLSKDLGYQITTYRESQCKSFRDPEEDRIPHYHNTPECTVDYMRFAEKNSQDRYGICIDLLPCSETGYLGQLIASEVQILLQNSAISYKSPF